MQVPLLILDTLHELGANGFKPVLDGCQPSRKGYPEDAGRIEGDHRFLDNVRKCFNLILQNFYKSLVKNGKSFCWFQQQRKKPHFPTTSSSSSFYQLTDSVIHTGFTPHSNFKQTVHVSELKYLIPEGFLEK